MIIPSRPAVVACRHYSWTQLMHFLTLICLTLAADSNEQPSNLRSHLRQQHHHHRDYKATVDAKPNPYQHIQILIPNLPPVHYQYWLKNHPRASKVFGEICEQVGPKLSTINDLAEFQRIHSNLSFEDPQYLNRLEYGKHVLGLICSKIRDISKSCWGYENNCQDIYLMPECSNTKTDRQAKDEQEQKITWFSQADFGYILDRARELSKYCAPEKKADPNQVSTFECTKHFTTCRGSNLYLQFNISALTNKRLSTKVKEYPPLISEVGGWACDLQSVRINEESGREHWLQSWYSDLKKYQRVDHLKPMENCEISEEKQVFFVKIKSTNNLDDYLSSFINLYATIHLNNRFSDYNRIIIWDKHLPRSKTFEQLWYAFSRLPPISIGQLDGKKVCFKKFIFVMPPAMDDGLHSDKPLIEGCSKSGLYDAFRMHVVHRLRIPNMYNQNFHEKTKGRLLRIAILSRTSKSEFRNILNEDEIEQALRDRSTNYNVKVLKYNSMDFGHLLLDVLNSDIMIGLHGTGLAYSLFLPDWAGLIELHDCGKDRYHKLARLRGISYFKPSDIGSVSNFVKKVRVSEQSEDWARLNQSRLIDLDEYNNYEVNLKQFMKLFDLASSRVYAARNNHLKQQEDSGQTKLSVTTTKDQSDSILASAEQKKRPDHLIIAPSSTDSPKLKIATSAEPSKRFANVPDKKQGTSDQEKPSNPTHNEL